MLTYCFSAVAVAIAENIFSHSLQTKLVELVIPIPTADVILAGATGIGSLTSDPTAMRLIQDAYCYAFQITMYYALAALIVATPFAAGMQWLKAKKVASG